MSDGTAIQWTDATWNPITGCSVVSPGCTNCYAMQLAGTRLRNHPSRAGLTKEVNGRHVWTGEVRLNREWLDQPLHWRKPRKVFVCAHADLFHENVPDEWRAAIFGVMAACPQHTFQVLTKRPDRALRWFAWFASELHGHPSMLLEDMAEALNPSVGTLADLYRRSRDAAWPLPNVHFGVSVEDQQRADRIRFLLQIPAAVRWVSFEPLLGPVDLVPWLFVPEPFGAPADLMPRNRSTFDPALDWLVIGGESGRNARPCDLAWIRSLVAQGREAGVPVYVKQLGSRPIGEPYLKANSRWVLTDDHPARRGEIILADPHGGDPSEWPENLMVREWPA